MMISNRAVIATACAALLSGGTTSAQIGDGCQTPGSCWDQMFCPLVQHCRTNIPNYPTVEDFRNCLNSSLTGQNSCLAGICRHKWAQGDAPTNADCVALFKHREAGCRSTKICGIDIAFVQPASYQDAIRKTCLDAADRELAACGFAANPDSGFSAEAMGGNLVVGGSLQSGQWDPSAGESLASLVLVPITDEASEIDRVVVESLVWSGEGWEYIVVGEFQREAIHHMIDAQIDLQAVSQAVHAQELNLLVQWFNEDELVWAVYYPLPIAESGVPGDFNRDGQRSTDDLAAFIDAYDNNAPRADRNGDRVVNATDLALFLAEYDGE